MFSNNELPAMALCAAQLVTDADRKRDVTACVFEQCSPVEVLKRMDEWRAQNRELPCSSQVEACDIFELISMTRSLSERWFVLVQVEEAIWREVNDRRDFASVAPLVQYHEKLQQSLIAMDDVLPLLRFLVQHRELNEAAKVLVHYAEVQCNSQFVQTLHGQEDIDPNDLLRVGLNNW